MASAASSGPPPKTPYPPGTPYSGYITRNVAIAFIILEVFFVGLRYLAQRLGRKPWGWDDWVMLPALILCLGVNTSSLIGLHLGDIGYHLIDVAEHNPAALIPWAKVLVVTPIIYSVACCLPKVVILLLYLRIFSSSSYRNACYILLAIVVALAISDVVAGATLCTPISYLWDKTIEGGHCINIPVFYRWGTLPNAITDLFMLILPLPVVWKLHAARRVKIGLTITFLTGSIGFITSIVRCVEFFTHDPLEDGTWISVTFLNWSIIEPGVYLIAACLPCYRPFMTYLSTGNTRTTDGSRRDNTTGGVSGVLSRPFGAKHQSSKFNSLGDSASEYPLKGIHQQRSFVVHSEGRDEGDAGQI